MFCELKSLTDSIYSHLGIIKHTHLSWGMALLVTHCCANIRNRVLIPSTYTKVRLVVQTIIQEVDVGGDRNRLVIGACWPS